MQNLDEVTTIAEDYGKVYAIIDKVMVTDHNIRAAFDEVILVGTGLPSQVKTYNVVRMNTDICALQRVNVAGWPHPLSFSRSVARGPVGFSLDDAGMHRVAATHAEGVLALS